MGLNSTRYSFKIWPQAFKHSSLWGLPHFWCQPPVASFWYFQFGFIIQSWRCSSLRININNVSACNCLHSSWPILSKNPSFPLPSLCKSWNEMTQEVAVRNECSTDILFLAYVSFWSHQSSLNLTGTAEPSLDRLNCSLCGHQHAHSAWR